MAFGQDIDPQAERLKRAQQQREEYVEEPEPDRFDECKNGGLFCSVLFSILFQKEIK